MVEEPSNLDRLVTVTCPRSTWLALFTVMYRQAIYGDEGAKAYEALASIEQILHLTPEEYETLARPR